MRKTVKKDLSVYDFDEEEESVEEQSGIIKSKFASKRPTNDAAIDKYTFIQCFTPGIDLDREDVAHASPIDLCEKDDTPVEEEPSLFEEKSEADEVTASSSNSDEISQEESGEYSVGQRESSGSPSHETSVDAILEDEESSDCDFRSPSTSASDHSEDQGFLGWSHPEFESYESDVAVIVFPDYVLFGKTVYVDSQFGFFSDCIKMEYFDASVSKKFVLEGLLADIIEIDCCWSRSAEVAIVKVSLSTTTTSDGTKRENEDSDTVKLIFSVTGIQWLDKEQKIKSLSPRYKDVWISHSNDVNKSEDDFEESNMFIAKRYFTEIDEPFEDVIYPKGDPDAVSISKRDIELLQPDTFINDTIIDFYVKYLKNKIQPGEKHRFHFFNSFFFRKLADLDKDPGSVLESRAAFLRVRKWTRKVNIFDKDYIFIPVNYNLHWSLLVICHPGQISNTQDDIKESPKFPCILHMDSIKGNHSGLRTLIQNYLKEEWKERYPESSEENLSNFSNLRFVELELPQQENSSDCGLFLLHYTELFLEKAPANFNPFKVTKFSRFLTADWFVPSEASLKRSFIRKLIYDLLKVPSHSSSGNTETKNKQEPPVVSAYSSEVKPEFSDSAHIVPDSRIEIKLLTPTISGVTQCDKGVLREFLAPRPAAESSSNCGEHPFQPTAISQSLNIVGCTIEESVDTSEQLASTSLHEDICQPVPVEIKHEQICTTSYSPMDAEISTMQEMEELGVPSSPGPLNDDPPLPDQTEKVEFSVKSCGYAPDSPSTCHGEKLDSHAVDSPKINITKEEGSHFDDSHAVHTRESNLDDEKDAQCSDVKLGEIGDCQDIIASEARGVSGENPRSMDSNLTTSENCTQTNSADEGGSGQCQETGTSDHGPPCLSGQSWQEIISSDEESTVDKAEVGAQLKRRKIMPRKTGKMIRRHTRSMAKNARLDR